MAEALAEVLLSASLTFSYTSKVSKHITFFSSSGLFSSSLISSSNSFNLSSLTTTSSSNTSVTSSIYSVVVLTGSSITSSITSFGVLSDLKFLSIGFNLFTTYSLLNPKGFHLPF